MYVFTHSRIHYYTVTVCMVVLFFLYCIILVVIFLEYVLSIVYCLLLIKVRRGDMDVQTLQNAIRVTENVHTLHLPAVQEHGPVMDQVLMQRV